jgi:transposase-like protein
MTEIRNRGTHDALIAVVDGLKGFPELIAAVFPSARVQTCIVHLIRYSMQFASWNERKLVAAALKPVYRAERCFCKGDWPQNSTTNSRIRLYDLATRSDQCAEIIGPRSYPVRASKQSIISTNC